MAGLSAAARHATIIRAGNMSLGVNLLTVLTRKVAAALDADPNESAVARQLLQPVPANRPSAKQVTELIKRAAEIAEAEADAKENADVLHRENGWPTRREMGLATERRLTELATLRTFLIAHKEARLREVQGHKVRSALLAHALRQLGEQTEVGADDGIGQRGGSAGNLRRQTSFNRGQSPLRRPSFDGSQPIRRGASLDIPRQQSFNRGHAQQTPAAPVGNPDHLSKLQPMKKRRQSLDVTEISQGQVGDQPGTRGVVRQPSFTSEGAAPSPRTSVDGRPSVDSQRRSIERKRSFDGRGVAGAGSPRAAAAANNPGPFAVRRDGSRTSMDTAGSNDNDRQRRPSLRSASFNRSFSTGDLVRLGGGLRPDTAAAVAKSHRVAKELDEAEFKALEENFFDACARAIAPIARNYTKAQAAIANAGGSSGEGSPNAGSPERGVPERGEAEEGEPAAPSDRQGARRPGPRPCTGGRAPGPEAIQCAARRRRDHSPGGLRAGPLLRPGRAGPRTGRVPRVHGA